METVGFNYIGDRYNCSRSSPTLLVIRELFSEQLTNNWHKSLDLQLS